MGEEEDEEFVVAVVGMLEVSFDEAIAAVIVVGMTTFIRRASRCAMMEMGFNAEVGSEMESGCGCLVGEKQEGSEVVLI